MNPGSRGSGIYRDFDSGFDVKMGKNDEQRKYVDTLFFLAIRMKLQICSVFDVKIGKVCWDVDSGFDRVRGYDSCWEETKKVTSE